MVITNIIANMRKRNPNTNLMVIPTKTILTLLSLAMTQMTRTTVFEKKREKKMKILKIEKKSPSFPNEINFKKNDNSVVPCPLEIWFFFFCFVKANHSLNHGLPLFFP